MRVHKHPCVRVCVREKERDHDRGRKSTSSVALGKYHSETDRCLSPSDSYLHLTMRLAPWAWGHAYTHFDTHAQQCNKQTQCACLCVCVCISVYSTCLCFHHCLKQSGNQSLMLRTDNNIHRCQAPTITTGSAAATDTVGL